MPDHPATTARAWLFVPGDQPGKIARAMTAGADALILDLEDSVGASAKPRARAAVAEALRAHAGAAPELWVRINPLGSEAALADLAAVMPAAPHGIVLPKPDGAADALRLANYLEALEAASGLTPGRTRILPIATETPASVFNLGGYAQAGPRLAGLTWGAEDLPAAVGSATRNPDGSLNDLCRLARALCLAAAANAGVLAIETVYPDFRDDAGLRAFAAAGRREGFSGMLAIHPAQVPIINQVMTPTADELAQAAAVVARFAADPEAGVVALAGRMLDLPHLKQARRVLAMGRTARPG